MWGCCGTTWLDDVSTDSAAAQELSLDVSLGQLDDEVFGAVGASAVAIGGAGAAATGPCSPVAVEPVATDDAAAHSPPRWGLAPVGGAGDEGGDGVGGVPVQGDPVPVVAARGARVRV